MRIGIAGTGSIGLGSAAFLAKRGHEPVVWSPRGQSAIALKDTDLRASGIVEYEGRISVAGTAEALSRSCDCILIAAPLNAHRKIMDALVPNLCRGMTIFVSSMASLSALYLYERALEAGCPITVASFGTTTLTARKESETTVRVMTKRGHLGISVLPRDATEKTLAVAQSLFGDVFFSDSNPLASALSNINPVAHAPLALFNWTRIERAEHWPQYHYMTPDVASVISKLDGERRALALAFGLEVRTIETHFAQSFGSTKSTLADIAAEMHSIRQGPPGPVSTQTRFISEDVPYGLLFSLALAPLVWLSMPTTRTIVDMASLISGKNLMDENDFIKLLGIAAATRTTLLSRLSI